MPSNFSKANKTSKFDASNSSTSSGRRLASNQQGATSNALHKLSYIGHEAKQYRIFMLVKPLELPQNMLGRGDSNVPSIWSVHHLEV